MPFDPPQHKPGDPIKADEVNARNEEIRRLGSARRQAGRAGETIYIRLTGPCNAAGAYPWVEVYAAPSGTWTTSERTGTLASDPAYERQSKDLTLTADGTVYEAARGVTSGELLFDGKN